jgi:HK97 family phage major capsid protein
VTGTLVGPQTEAGPVASQDMTDDYIEAKAKTIAGQNDVSMQLLDLSPGQIIDQVIMNDLVADYDRQVDRDVIRGVGGTKITGIWPAGNWGAGTVATATAAAGSGQAFFQTQGAMAAKLATQRFSTVNAHFLSHPRRWYWWATTVDGPSGTRGRPLVGSGMAAMNPVAAETAAPAEGKVGSAVFGPHDYYSSTNVPTTDNGSGVLSGTFDPVILAKWDDIWLFEDALRMRVLDGPLSGTLQVRFQIYNYVAQLVRYGQSIVIAQGAGLAPPTGAIDTAMVFGA